MSRKRILYTNILETGTVTLGAGTADAEFVLANLYDRDPGVPFKPTAAVTIVIKIDQGASSIQAVDRIMLLGNLDGMTLDIEHSTDDAAYTPAVPQWVQAGNGLVNKTWASLTKRYWRFIITTPASVPEIMELFLGLTYELERNPSYGSLARGLRDGNVRTDLDGGCVVFYDKWVGQQKKYRRWPLSRATSAMAANVNALDAACAGKRPFFVEDDDGTWFFAEQLKRLEESAKGYNYSSYELEVLEVLP